MEPSVNKILNKLSKNKNNQDKVELATQKIDLAKKDQLESLYNESEKLNAVAVKRAKEVEKAYQSANKANDKVANKLYQNYKQARKIAQDMEKAYKMLDETPPPIIESYVNDINDFAARTPVSNLANIYPL